MHLKDIPAVYKLYGITPEITVFDGHDCVQVFCLNQDSFCGDTIQILVYSI